MIVLNAFSLNMLATRKGSLAFQELSLEEAKSFLTAGFESAVGHADTAAVFSSVLGIDVPANRSTITLHKGDQALVGQYRGPRLLEGARTLPEGATIAWYHIAVE